MTWEAPVLSARARNAMITLITVLWAGNFVMTWINPEYKPEPSINAVFTGMIGAVLAAPGKKGEDKEDSSK